jgi:Flp pilus assembly protein protease CpaA
VETNMMIEMHLRWVGVLLVSGIAAVHDARSGHIPNWLVALGLALGAGGSIAALALADVPEALARTGSAALGFVACGAVPLLLFRLQALGGGDVKLLATVGAQLGPLMGLELSFAAFAVAATYWPLRCVGARVLQAARQAGREARGTKERLAIAFAPCLFVAAIALSASHWSTS